MKDTERAREQARAQLDSIVEMVKAMENGGEIDGEQVTHEQAEQLIQESPLAIEVRTEWHTVGAEDNKPTEYNILLCTGGPAVRIIGELNEYGEPETAKMEYIDWFTPWQWYGCTSQEEAMLLTYAQQFYYGEG